MRTFGGIAGGFFFTYRMPFLTPSQQCQNTEGISTEGSVYLFIIGPLFDSADESLFKTGLSDIYYVLHRLLPENKTVPYNLRSRSHNLTLTCKSFFYDGCNLSVG